VHELIPACTYKKIQVYFTVYKLFLNLYKLEYGMNIFLRTEGENPEPEIGPEVKHLRTSGIINSIYVFASTVGAQYFSPDRKT